MSQIEDRVLNKDFPPPNTGTGLKIKGIHTVPFISTLLGITVLALGIPVWVGIDTFLPWVIANAWTLALTTPLLVVSLLTPFVIARIISKTNAKFPPAMSVDVNGTIQMTPLFQWELLVELNEAAIATNEELQTAIKEIISKIDSSSPLSVRDPLWATVFPTLTSGSGPSRARTSLAKILIQANPTLAQFELIPPLDRTSLLPERKTEEILKTQT
ncbi:MAG: hypothetical protein IPN90_04220 [Elusimicrobia bacterium]|nr:hypothetical protein [Elusimicrobiota bacterium]